MSLKVFPSKITILSLPLEILHQICLQNEISTDIIFKLAKSHLILEKRLCTNSFYKKLGRQYLISDEEKLTQIIDIPKEIILLDLMDDEKDFYKKIQRMVRREYDRYLYRFIWTIRDYHSEYKTMIARIWLHNEGKYIGDEESSESSRKKRQMMVSIIENHPRTLIKS